MSLDHTLGIVRRYEPASEEHRYAVISRNLSAETYEESDHVVFSSGDLEEVVVRFIQEESCHMFEGLWSEGFPGTETATLRELHVLRLRELAVYHGLDPELVTS